MKMLKYSTEWHGSIPAHSVLRNADLSRDARLLWAVLQSYASPDSPNPYPSHFTLMKNMGCKKTALKKYMVELQEKGFLNTEQARRSGRWLANVYILKLPDSTGAVHTATVPTATANTAALDAAPSNRQSKSIPKKESKYQQKQKAADAAGGADGGHSLSGADAPEEKELNDGTCFMARWSQCFQQWFGAPYLQKPGEAVQANKLIKTLDCRPKDLLAYALRMWINTSEADFVNAGQYDPLFYQIKGSRSARFFLNNLSDIAEEQEHPLDCALRVTEPDFQELEALVKVGRPEAC
jgi:hypothetical protein